METAQPYLVVGILGSFVGSASLLFLTFTLWIYSLESSLDVHAPLVDGARKKSPSRQEGAISPGPKQFRTAMHTLH